MKEYRPIPTEQDGRIALLDHAVHRALETRARIGGPPDASRIVQLLSDPAFARYPTRLRFDDGPLNPDEFGQIFQRSDDPRDGFDLVLATRFEHRPETWPAMIAYFIPAINYGEIVTAEVCEAFGSALLGVPRDDYYDTLCALADEADHF